MRCVTIAYHLPAAYLISKASKAFWLLAAFALPVYLACAQDALPFSQTNRINYDSHCLQIDGEDKFIYSGSFHYFRCPKELWRARFQKIKDAGFNAVETYVPWNWHEPEAPVSPADFSQVTGLQDLDDWMSMAEEFGLYIIIRPGPYICAEWDGGGFPQWLVALKKPVDWPVGKSWLQTTDPTFLTWNQHWYQAVCPIIAKHQITRKAPGQPGVILFQIENEYDRLNWLPHGMKKKYLESLATYAREFQIDVPLFTCYTSESRNVTNGPLKGVFDMMNYYPKWDVEKQVNKRTSQERPQQPYAPAMSAETQGGWYSEVGDKLSENQDGIAPVQTQNLTLYELQLGYSLINYYMLVGGSNPGDWASRETTTTYDYDAAIHEDGRVNERYQRVAGIGKMLQEHGKQLVRSEEVQLETIISDPAVEIAERKGQDGSRFFFVRTENRSGSHSGIAHVKESDDDRSFTFNFTIESFGSMILYLAPGQTNVDQGQWLPKLGSLPRSAINLPAPIVITEMECMADQIPTKWTSLPPGDTLEKHGVFDRHLIYYRLAPFAGQSFSVSRIGDKVVNGTEADHVLAMANGKLLVKKFDDNNSVTFTMPTDAHQATLLFESCGLHQHTNPTLEENWLNGIRCVKSGTNNLPLQFATNERERGLAFSNPKSCGLTASAPIKTGKDDLAPDALFSWYRMKFDLPEKKTDANSLWHLHLEAHGNGFIYFNGHCLGRYWEAGPQRNFFLPECWLNFGSKQNNIIALSLYPLNKGVSVENATVTPDVF